MSLLINFIGKIFGNKYDKDIKKINPLVEEINNEFLQLNSISNDDLRKKTIEFKTLINDSTIVEKEKISILNKNVKDSKTSPEEKEEIYKQIDELEKTILENIEVCLTKILPKAFAVVKETAKRFTENTSIEVTATENDIVLANTKDFVKINKDKAIYNNYWDLAGASITWNMIHYDVQLIEGLFFIKEK